MTSENELQEIYNHERYDKEIIDFIEVFGAYVVSHLFNNIYNKACIAKEKSRENSSIFTIYEIQLYLYADQLKNPAGINNEIKNLHAYFNSKTQRMDPFIVFCRRFAAVFIQNVPKDQSTVMNIVINSMQSIIIHFIGEVAVAHISLILKQRTDADSPRQLQNKFLEVSLLHKYAENKKMRLIKTTTKSGINNEVISDMSSLIEKHRATIAKLTQENEKLKKVLITQNQLVQKIRADRKPENIHPPARTSSYVSSTPFTSSTPSTPFTSSTSSTPFTPFTSSTPYVPSTPHTPYVPSTPYVPYVPATSRFEPPLSPAEPESFSQNLQNLHIRIAQKAEPEVEIPQYIEEETPKLEENVFNMDDLYNN